jgi:hypothetical protein
MNGDDDQMRSPAKCDTLRSTDSASGGETLEERSSKEVRSFCVSLDLCVIHFKSVQLISCLASISSRKT